MNEKTFAPKPEEVAPTLKSPDEVNLPYAETLRGGAMPDDGKNVSTLINKQEAFSQTGTLRSAEEYETPVESEINEKNPDSISAMGTAPISSEVISEESYPFEEVVNPLKKKPEGFSLHDVPEWEFKARGTVPASEISQAPNSPKAMEDVGNETLRAA